MSPLSFTALTRRRYPERPECWHVYGDVHVGMIARRVGCPVDVDQWGWTCGFLSGLRSGPARDGTAATFDDAGADFDAAWQALLSTRTEADFQAWRDPRDWTARKRAMSERSELMPSQKPNTMMRCACGEMFDSHQLGESLVHIPHILAEFDANQIRRRQPTFH